MSALSCVMLGGDGGYKINVYNIGMTCSAESHIIDRRTYGSPIDRVSMMCMGDTLCDVSRQTKPWGESNLGCPFVVRHRVVLPPVNNTVPQLRRAFKRAPEVLGTSKS